jgi:hypothetical protein
VLIKANQRKQTNKKQKGKEKKTTKRQKYLDIAKRRAVAWKRHPKRENMW